MGRSHGAQLIIPDGAALFMLDRADLLILDAFALEAVAIPRPAIKLIESATAVMFLRM